MRKISISSEKKHTTHANMGGKPKDFCSEHTSWHYPTRGGRGWGFLLSLSVKLWILYGKHTYYRFALQHVPVNTETYTKNTCTIKWLNTVKKPTRGELSTRLPAKFVNWRKAPPPPPPPDIWIKKIYGDLSIIWWCIGQVRKPDSVCASMSAGTAKNAGTTKRAPTSKSVCASKRAGTAKCQGTSKSAGTAKSADTTNSMGASKKRPFFKSG